MEKKIIEGYALSYDDTVRLAGEIASTAYENRVMISLNKIDGCRESGTIIGQYDSIWSCWYDNGTGLYIFASDNGGEEWFTNIVRKVCGEDAVIYKD